MYADEPCVTLTSNKIKELLENAMEEMRNIPEWVRVKKLSTNPQNTKYMVICTHGQGRLDERAKHV